MIEVITFATGLLILCLGYFIGRNQQLEKTIEVRKELLKALEENMEIKEWYCDSLPMLTDEMNKIRANRSKRK